MDRPYPLLVIAGLLTHVCTAQSYTFEQSTVPYLGLPDPSPCYFDDSGFDALTELDGEVFNFFGQAYTAGSPSYSLRIGTYGFVRADGNGTSIIIDGLFTELAAVDATSRVEYSISGGPGTHVLTAQWTNWHLNLGPDGNYASFQITVEQATGVVSVHVGPNSGGGLDFTDLTGPNCGIFQANNAFTLCHAKLWVEGDPEEPSLDTQANFDFDALHGIPAAGTLYRFVPATAGIASLEARPIQAYVAADGIHVEGMTGTHTLGLVDASGREVRRMAMNGTAAVMSTEGLVPGIYLLRCVDNSLLPVRLWVP